MESKNVFFIHIFTQKQNTKYLNKKCFSAINMQIRTAISA